MPRRHGGPETTTRRNSGGGARRRRQSRKSNAKPTATPVFPASVPAKFAELRPAQARQKTCSEQYQANKASNGNAGLRWLEKGGGYWSLCNRKLKGA